jgi:murein DD-endopeptidase MepM/ murein hydrolase activator NlpD
MNAASGLRPASIISRLTFLALTALWTTSCSTMTTPPAPASAGLAAPPAPSASAASNDTVYYLPFDAGAAYLVGQGNFGVVGLGSHGNEYAIDFVMPEGTPVLAARGGIVISMREDCPNVNCPFNPESCCGNYMKIRHSDRTVAAYWHLPQGGACVNVGDVVSRGDVIAVSGNTGVSMMPHLHFAVFARSGRTGTGSHGPSQDRSMQVRFQELGGDGVPMFLGTYTSQNLRGADNCAAGLIQ